MVHRANNDPKAKGNFSSPIPNRIDDPLRHNVQHVGPKHTWGLLHRQNQNQGFASEDLGPFFSQGEVECLPPVRFAKALKPPLCESQSNWHN